MTEDNKENEEKEGIEKSYNQYLEWLESYYPMLIDNKDCPDYLREAFDDVDLSSMSGKEIAELLHEKTIEGTFNFPVGEDAVDPDDFQD